MTEDWEPWDDEGSEHEEEGDGRPLRNRRGGAVLRAASGGEGVNTEGFGAPPEAKIRLNNTLI